MRQIPLEQVVERAIKENPWWDEPFSIPSPFDSWTPRPYLNLFYPLVTNREVRRAVVLMGPRRVGKTVMLHHTVERLLKKGIPPKRICYLSVDHPLYNGLRLDELLDVYQRASGVDISEDECYVCFDEIQYLRDWEIQLKALVDENSKARFIGSGSAAAALRLKSRESGAGRFTDFLLPPLTFHEYLFLLGKTGLVDGLHLADGFMDDVGSRDIDELNRSFVDYINFGGYPEVAFTPGIRKDPARFVKNDIIDKVLLRDLPSLYGVQDIQELNYLFTTLAYNTANEVSLEQLSTGSGVAKNTIKKYIEYLEAAFLIKVVHRVDRSGKRFKRANFFKVYLTNPSIRSALFTPVEADDGMMGSLVETAIFSQWFHSEEPLYYARWRGGEVDLVGLGTGQDAAWALEAKWSDRFFERPGELKSLIKFCHAHNLGEGSVTTKTKEGIIKKDNISLRFRPASLYCYILGYNILHSRSKAWKT